MNNYDSVISQLGKQVAQLAPQNSPVYNTKSWIDWKSYYIYILIPVSAIVIMLFWRPNVIMQKNNEGKRSIIFKKFSIAVVIMSVIFSGLYVGYKLKFST